MADIVNNNPVLDGGVNDPFAPLPAVKPNPNSAKGKQHLDEMFDLTEGVRRDRYYTGTIGEQGSYRPGKLMIENKDRYWRGAYSEIGMNYDELSDMRARFQGTSTKVGNAFAQFAGTLLFDTWAGIGAILTAPSQWGSMAARAVTDALGKEENAFADYIERYGLVGLGAVGKGVFLEPGNQASEWLRNEAAPIYTNKASQEGSLWNKMGEGDWWISNAPTLASAISSIVPVMGAARLTSLAGKALGATNALGKTGVLGRAIKQTGNVLDSNAGRTINSTLLGTHLDVTMETSRMVPQLIEQLQHERELGLHNMSDVEIEKTAGDAAAESYRLGYLGEVAGNAVTFSVLFGTGGRFMNRAIGNNERTIVKNIQGEIRDRVANKTLITPGSISAAAAKPATNKALRTTVDYLKTAGSEGWEELWVDYALIKGEQYGRSINKAPENPDYAEYKGMDGFVRFMSDSGNYDSFFWGGLGGAFATSFRSVFQRGVRGQEGLDRERKMMNSIVDNTADLINKFQMVSEIMAQPDGQTITYTDPVTGAKVPYLYEKIEYETDSKGYAKRNVTPNATTTSKDVVINDIIHSTFKNLFNQTASTGNFETLETVFKELAGVSDLQVILPDADSMTADEIANRRDTFRRLGEEFEKAKDIYSRALGRNYGFDERTNAILGLELASATWSEQYWNQIANDADITKEEAKARFFDVNKGLLEETDRIRLRKQEDVTEATRKVNDIDSEIAKSEKTVGDTQDLINSTQRDLNIEIDALNGLKAQYRRRDMNEIRKKIDKRLRVSKKDLAKLREHMSSFEGAELLDEERANEVIEFIERRILAKQQMIGSLQNELEWQANRIGELAEARVPLLEDKTNLINELNAIGQDSHSNKDVLKILNEDKDYKKANEDYALAKKEADKHFYQAYSIRNKKYRDQKAAIIKKTLDSQRAEEKLAIAQSLRKAKDKEERDFILKDAKEKGFKTSDFKDDISQSKENEATNKINEVDAKAAELAKAEPTNVGQPSEAPEEVAETSEPAEAEIKSVGDIVAEAVIKKNPKKEEIARQRKIIADVREKMDEYKTEVEEARNIDYNHPSTSNQDRSFVIYYIKERFNGKSKDEILGKTVEDSKAFERTDSFIAKMRGVTDAIDYLSENKAIDDDTYYNIRTLTDIDSSIAIADKAHNAASVNPEVSKWFYDKFVISAFASELDSPFVKNLEEVDKELFNKTISFIEQMIGTINDFFLVSNDQLVLKVDVNNVDLNKAVREVLNNKALADDVINYALSKPELLKNREMFIHQFKNFAFALRNWASGHGVGSINRITQEFYDKINEKGLITVFGEFKEDDINKNIDAKVKALDKIIATSKDEGEINTAREAKEMFIDLKDNIEIFNKNRKRPINFNVTGDFVRFISETKRMMITERRVAAEDVKLRLEIYNGIFSLLLTNVNSRKDVTEDQRDKIKKVIVASVFSRNNAILRDINAFLHLSDSEKHNTLYTNEISVMAEMFPDPEETTVKEIREEYASISSDIDLSTKYANSDTDILVDEFGRYEGAIYTMIYKVIKGIKQRRGDIHRPLKNKLQLADILKYIAAYDTTPQDTIERYFEYIYAVWQDITNDSSTFNSGRLKQRLMDELESTDDPAKIGKIEYFFLVQDELKNAFSRNDGLPSSGKVKALRQNGKFVPAEVAKWIIKHTHPSLFNVAARSGVASNFIVDGVIREHVDIEKGMIMTQDEIQIDKDGNIVEEGGVETITVRDLLDVMSKLSTRNSLELNIADLTVNDINSNSEVPITATINKGDKKIKVNIASLKSATVAFGGLTYYDAAKGESYYWMNPTADGLSKNVHDSRIDGYAKIFANQHYLARLGKFFRAYNDYYNDKNDENWKALKFTYEDVIDPGYKHLGSDQVQSLYNYIINLSKPEDQRSFDNFEKDITREEYDAGGNETIIDAVQSIINPMFYNRLDDSMDVNAYGLDEEVIKSIYNGYADSLRKTVKRRQEFLNDIREYMIHNPNTPMPVNVSYIGRPEVIYKDGAKKVTDVINPYALKDGKETIQIFYKAEEGLDEDNMYSDEGARTQDISKWNKSVPRVESSMSDIGRVFEFVRPEDGKNIKDLTLGDNDSPNRIIRHVEQRGRQYLYALSNLYEGVEGSSPIPVRNARIDRLGRTKNAEEIKDAVLDNIFNILNASTEVDPNKGNSYKTPSGKFTGDIVNELNDVIIVNKGVGHINARYRKNGVIMGSPYTVYFAINNDYKSNFTDKQGYLHSGTVRTIEFRSQNKEGKTKLYRFQRFIGTRSLDGKVVKDSSGRDVIFNEYRLQEHKSSDGIAIRGKKNEPQWGANLLVNDGSYFSETTGDKKKGRPELTWFTPDNDMSDGTKESIFEQDRVKKLLDNIAYGLIRNVPIDHETNQYGHNKEWVDNDGRYHSPYTKKYNKQGEVEGDGSFDSYMDFIFSTGALYTNASAMFDEDGKPVNNFNYASERQPGLWIDTKPNSMENYDEFGESTFSIKNHIERKFGDNQKLSDVAQDTNTVKDTFGIKDQVENAALFEFLDALVQEKINPSFEVTNNDKEMGGAEALYSPANNVIKLNTAEVYEHARFGGRKRIPNLDMLKRAVVHESIHAYINKHISDNDVQINLTNIKDYIVSFFNMSENKLVFDDNGLPAISNEGISLLGEGDIAIHKLALQIILKRVVEANQSNGAGMLDIDGFQEAITYAFTNVVKVTINGVETSINIAEHLNNIDGKGNVEAKGKSFLSRLVDYIIELFGIKLKTLNDKQSVLTNIRNILTSTNAPNTEFMADPMLEYAITMSTEGELDIDSDDYEASDFDSDEFYSISEGVSISTINDMVLLDDEYLPIC